MRNILFRFHKLLGLYFAIFFGFMFLTGGLLVLAGDIEKLLNPTIRAEISDPVDLATPGETYDRIRQELPGTTIYVMGRTPYEGAGDRNLVTKANGETVLIWTDPQTGEIIAETARRSFKVMLTELHEQLFVPHRLAYLAVTATSLFLLYSVISGLVSYRRFWRGLFRVPSSDLGDRARAGGWHRLVGLWSAPFLFLIAITSFFFFLGGLGLVVERAPPLTTAERATILPAEFDGATLDKGLLAAEAAHPGFVVKTTILPDRTTATIRYSGHLGKPRIKGNYSIAVHPDTLEVLGLSSPDDSKGLGALSGLMYALHFGTWGGRFSVYLWVGFAALSMGLLAYGGRVLVTRMEHPSHPSNSSRIARFWRANGVLRWGYILALAGIVAMVVLREVI